MNKITMAVYDANMHDGVGMKGEVQACFFMIVVNHNLCSDAGIMCNNVGILQALFAIL